MTIQPALIKRVINLAVQIQQIPAATFHESQRAAFIQAHFKELGASDVRKDDCGNVYARVKGDGKGSPIVVSAHLDTVFPLGTDLTTRRTTEKVYGPGIGDNSVGLAGLCGLLWAFGPNKRLLSNKLHLGGDLWLVANVGEEGLGNLKGMKAVVDHYQSAPVAYLVLEGMALGQIYHRGLGVRRYRIRIHTAGGHSWVNFGSPSAIHELAKLVVKFNDLSLPTEPRTSLNIGMISGGTSVNTIAAEASCELDLRSENAKELSSLCEKVLRLVDETNEDGTRRVRVEAEMIGERPAGEIPADHPLVRSTQNCYAAHGIKAKLNIGSTDANEPLSRGLPAICVGLTTGGASHTLGEYIDTRPVATGLEILADLIQMLDRGSNQ